MPDETGEPPPVAVVRRSVGRRWHVPLIWMVPVVAAVIAAWLAWDTLSKQGRVITVSFQSAEGLQAGQSPLKFKDITLGRVQGFKLSEDRSRVIVTVATSREAEPLLTDQALFWVVRPRLFAGNLSGLGTLLSGGYIQMRPGPSGGSPRWDFVGLEDPPVLESEVPGRTFLLKAQRIGSISLGSPVFFRDMTVGEVLGWDIADMAQSVTLHVFVREPFDRYVRDDSRFWNASGVMFRLGAEGLDVQLESLRAVLLGGIAFETPDGGSAKASAENHRFPLYPNQGAAEAASYVQRVAFVAYFPGSVRGLGPGADVTLHGLKIGSVTGVSLSYDPVKDEIVAPVHFEVEPERAAGIRDYLPLDTAAKVDELIRRGLRANLETANLITGQKLVALDFEPNGPAAPVRREGDAFVVPTAPGGGGLEGLQAGAGELLAKVNAIPFEQIGHNLDRTLESLSNVASGPELKQALASLAATMAGVQDTVRKLDKGMTPVLRQLPGIAAELQKTVAQTNRLARSVEAGYGENTKINRDLGRLLVQANDAVRSVRSLADLLTRHPEVLIRGRSNRGLE